MNYNINPISSAMFITATAPNPLIVSFDKGDGWRAEHDPNVGYCGASSRTGITGCRADCNLVALSASYHATPNAPQFARQKLDALGPLSLAEKITPGCSFCCSVYGRVFQQC